MHYRSVTHRGDSSTLRPGSLELKGDAHLTLTAPFYVEGDPHDSDIACVLPAGDNLDGSGTFLRRPISVEPLLRGSLTFHQPVMDFLTCFAGDDAWCEDVRCRLGERLAQRGALTIDRVDVRGMLFPDGYGSIAVKLALCAGWDAHRRTDLAASFGRGSGDELASELRSLLLPPAQAMLRRCGAGETAEVALPYFNLTYAGHTDHPDPGRSTLDDDLRALIYPNSPQPLTSGSPLREEFFYPGYAFNVLAAGDLGASLEKLTLLLLVMDVSYARLARNAEAAQRSLDTGDISTDLAKLVDVEHRLRSEYQSLISPTFSFDHHALMLRDALLHTWQADKLHSRADGLLTMLRQTIERTMAAEQARRTHRINVVVTLLTVLSAVATIEATVALYDYFFA